MGMLLPALWGLQDDNHLKKTEKKRKGKKELREYLTNDGDLLGGEIQRLESGMRVLTARKGWEVDGRRGMMSWNLVLGESALGR